MDVSDEDLARAAAGGDRAAFSALLARHYDRLYRFAWRLTGAQADAEDLTQDICAALPAKLATWRGEGALTTWLYRVAVNAAHDRRRRASRRAQAASDWGEVEIARQAEAADAAAAQDWLARAMAQLAPDLQDTVALTLGEDMTHAEAAAVLGVSEGTISWRLSEVRKRLKALAEEEMK